MLGRTDSRGRLLLLLCALIVASCGMTARLAYWQLNQQDQLTQFAAQTSTQLQRVPARRGTIYDRTGTIVLAQTINEYQVIGDPHDLTKLQQQRDSEALVDYLNLSGAADTALRKAMSGGAYYIVLASGVDASTAADIKAEMNLGGLPGISLDTTPVRVYPQAGGAPNTSLAAQFLGFVNADGKGQYGVEQEYDSVLAGTPETLQIDPTINGPSGAKILDPGKAGSDIRTTIDVGLQLKLEQEVFSTWVADKAQTVSGVVMDPKTGELLAEASYPSYDANQYIQVANQRPDLFEDPIITGSYEPGSVFKMLTASAALTTRTTSLLTKINDYGVMHLPGGIEIADANRKSMGWMTFQDIVAYSRNVGVTQAAFKLGKSTTAASVVLYNTWKQYGITDKTGVDLAGEVGSVARDPSVDPWQQVDLANASFGQGVQVTPLQVLRAYTAMANGGNLITPCAVLPANGSTPTGNPKKIISASLSTSLTGLMQHVLTTVPSYNVRTYIPGYYVGGKTGTAQIWDPLLDHGRGAWSEDYNYSFFGWVGHSGPQLMIGAVIYSGTPTKKAQGVLDMPVQSYELFRRIATDAVTTERIPPNSKSPSGPGSQKATPQG
jgi:cell division protein FtsI/penicillin-binding protein 2